MQKIISLKKLIAKFSVRYPLFFHPSFYAVSSKLNVNLTITIADTLDKRPTDPKKTMSERFLIHSTLFSC